MSIPDYQSLMLPLLKLADKHGLRKKYPILLMILASMLFLTGCDEHVIKMSGGRGGYWIECEGVERAGATKLAVTVGGENVTIRYTNAEGQDGLIVARNCKIE